MTQSMKRIHSITIKRMYDPDPDTSYLEQDEFADRLDQYKRDVFSFIGIRADAEINIPGGDLAFIAQDITSGGLWGIESDSDAAYLKEIEDEQLSELRDQLHAIGFSNRAISAGMREIEREENYV